MDARVFTMGVGEMSGIMGRFAPMGFALAFAMALGLALGLFGCAPAPAVEYSATSSSSAPAPASASASAFATLADAIPVKVLLLPKFEVGELSGDDPGEAQYYFERYVAGGQEYAVEGGGGDGKLYVKDGAALFITGTGKVNAALSMAALLADERFDFSDAYIVSTGCGGASKGFGVLGDVYIVTSIFDFDLGHSVDGRELSDPDGIAWFHNEDFDGTAFVELNRDLANKAYNLVKDTQLHTTDLARSAMRNSFAKEEWAQRDPRVLLGTGASSDTYWKGEFEHRKALLMEETYGAEDPFAITEMEDIAIAITLERAGMLDRFLVIRDAVNMDVLLEGDTPEDIWSEDDGDATEAGDSEVPLDIFPVAMENNYLVGSVVVDAILDGSLGV